MDKELFFSTLADFHWYALLARCISWCNAQMKTKTSTMQLVKTWAPTQLLIINLAITLNLKSSCLPIQANTVFIFT